MARPGRATARGAAGVRARSRAPWTFAIAIAVISRVVGVRAAVSTGAPLLGATNGAAEAVLDYKSVPGGRCSPNDSMNTIVCDKLEPASTKNYASFDFVVYDVNGARCDLCGRECSLDGSAWAYCGATPVWYFGLTVGQHQFKVRGLGGDNTPGNIPAVYNWVIEDPLTVEWDSAYATPSTYGTSNSVNTFYMQSSRPSSAYVQFEYSTTNDYIKTYTRLPTGTSSVNVTPSYGVNEFTFRAVSIESYTGKLLTESSVNQISVTYTIDNVNPSVTFVSGLADGANPSTDTVSYVVSSTDVDVVNSNVQSGLQKIETQFTRVDNGASNPSPLHTWMTYTAFSGSPTDKNVTVTLTNLATLADGTYELLVRSTDNAGNVATAASRRMAVQLASMMRVPDASGLNATTTLGAQTASGAITLASVPSDGSLVPTAYEVSGIVGGVLALESAPTVPLANNTLVSPSDATTGFRFTPAVCAYTGDALSSTFGFDLKPSTSTTDLTKVVDLPAHSYITVTWTNSPPILSLIAAYELTPIHIADAANMGTTVRDFLDAHVLDCDAQPSLRTVPYGVAVVGSDQTRGTWQFSTDSGASWTNFDTNGTLSTTNALILKAESNERVRFVPTFTSLEDEFMVSFAFRGWDGTTNETTGATGVNITTNSHTALSGSISASTATAFLLVRGFSHSIFERTDKTVTASTRRTFESGANSCPPSHRRSVRIPVATATEGAEPKIKSSSALTVTPPWTIEAWVRRDVWLTAQTLFTSPSDGSAIMLEMSEASGKVGIVLPSGVSGGTFNYLAPLGTWVHLAFVMYESSYPTAYSAPGANLRLVVNGAFHSELTSVGFNMPHGIIGGSGIAGFSIDEVRYWSVARSIEDIHTNMERFMAGSETGLVSYVPFDAGCGSSVSDRDAGSSATWTLTAAEWIDARMFKCAFVSAITPPVINLYNPQNTVMLIGERFKHPSSAAGYDWGSNSVSKFDGLNAVCIFGSSSAGNRTSPADVISDTAVLCFPPDVAHDVAVVQPVFCDYSLGCCTGETTVDYHIENATTRPYDANYVSYAMNEAPMYDTPSLTFSRGEITNMLPAAIDEALGGILTVTGYGFSPSIDTNFVNGAPKCAFRYGSSSESFYTDAELISDTLMKCEFPTRSRADMENAEARTSVEIALVYLYGDEAWSYHTGWIEVVVSSYDLHFGLDEPLTSVSELGGSVLSITAIFDEPDTSSVRVKRDSGRVTSTDVACAFGTVRPISARYNESETFECVAPAAPRATPTSVPLFVSLFASSMFTSFSQLTLLSSSGELDYVAQPIVTDIFPRQLFAVPTANLLFAVGSDFPSFSPRCRLNSTYLTVNSYLSSELVLCSGVGVGGATPGFHAVLVDNYMLNVDDVYSPGNYDNGVMIRDDAYVGTIVTAGVTGPLYGGWALTVSGSGFLPGDGCSLHVAPGEPNEVLDDPTFGHFVSSALMKCLAPRVEENPESWYLPDESSGWVTQLVARLAVESVDRNNDPKSHVKLFHGLNNASALANSYAEATSIEFTREEHVFLNPQGGSELALVAKNGTASFLSSSCRFGTIQVLADWSWSSNETSTTSLVRCISPAFGKYNANKYRFSVTQGDPGHYGEFVVDSLKMMKSIDDDTIYEYVNNAKQLATHFGLSSPSEQLALYECYVKGDRNFVLGAFQAISSKVYDCSIKNMFDQLGYRTDLAFVSFGIGIRGGEDVITPLLLQYTPPPMISSVAVSAVPPPYGYRPAFTESNCTTLKDAASMTRDLSHSVYEGRPQTPFEVEKFVLPALDIFGGAWWHVSNAVGNPLHIRGLYFKSPQDGGEILVSFKHEETSATARGHFVSSALILVEVPITVDGEHETTVRASVDNGVSWSQERVAFRIHELDYVDRDLQTIRQACAT